MDAIKGIDISIEKVPSQAINCWKIIITGYVDADTVEQLIGELMVLTRQKSVKLIVDLKGVTFMGCAGWSALTQIAEELFKAQGKIVILNMTPNMERTYKLLKLEATLPSFTNEDDALHYLL